MTFPTTLEAYMAEYAPILAKAAADCCRPLHTPGQDPVLDATTLLRPPLEGQLHVMTAIVRAWERQSGVIFSGGCGVGKTICAIGATHLSHNACYRALVFCPPHLVDKWEREVRATITKPRIVQLRTYRQLTGLERHDKPQRPEWWIVASTMAKLGPGWQPAVLPPLPVKRARRLKQVPDAFRCPRCYAPVVKEDPSYGVEVPVEEEDLKRRQHVCTACREPLWQMASGMDRFPIATFIHRQLKRAFDVAVIDESHQAAASDTLAGLAFGSLCAASRRVLCLTGTLMDGKAEELHPVLMRLSPGSLVAEGFEWGKLTSWNDQFGRMDRTEVLTVKANGKRQPGAILDRRRGPFPSVRTTRKVAPGVMPSLFPRHLIQNIVFLSLDQVAEGLPPMDEQCVSVEMDAEQAAQYRFVEDQLRIAMRDMLARHDRRLMGQMLHVLLGYTDHPHGWGDIGYYEQDPYGAQVWQSVVQPPDLDPQAVRPKERAILADVLAEAEAGRKCWVYSIMTVKRDVVSRLEQLMREAGLRVAVLRANVQARKREEWIAKNAPRADVLISYPKLVETGVDFFDSARTYNIPSIHFYQTGYSCKMLRQAASRAMRIGQWEDCRVRFYFYAGTMQARALTHVGRKLAAAQAVEGKFASGGPIAMTGEDGGLEAALARSLVERLDADLDVGQVWGRVQCGQTTEREVKATGQTSAGDRLMSDAERRLMEAMARGPRRQTTLW